MDGSARDGVAVAQRAAGRGEVGGADRSRTSRGTDSAKLRRQEHPDLALRTRASAARTRRWRRQSQIARPRHDLFDGRFDEGTWGRAVKSFLLSGGRVIDPANDVDRTADVLVIDGS